MANSELKFYHLIIYASDVMYGPAAVCKGEFTGYGKSPALRNSGASVYGFYTRAECPCRSWRTAK